MHTEPSRRTRGASAAATPAAPGRASASAVPMPARDQQRVDPAAHGAAARDAATSATPRLRLAAARRRAPRPRWCRPARRRRVRAELGGGREDLERPDHVERVDAREGDDDDVPRDCAAWRHAVTIAAAAIWLQGH